MALRVLKRRKNQQRIANVLRIVCAEQLQLHVNQIKNSTEIVNVLDLVSEIAKRTGLTFYSIELDKNIYKVEEIEKILLKGLKSEKK